MTDRLIRLYPADWRARYGDELMALLAERPPTIRDRIDIVRGAVDARVDPQVGLDRGPTPLSHRIPGLLAVVAGLIWSGAYLSVGLTGEDGNLSGLVPLALLLMFASLPGGYMADHARQLGWWGALAGVSLALGLVLPWGPNFIPILLVLAIVGAGMLGLAGVRAGLGSTARWWLLAIAFFGPAALMLTVWAGLVPGLPWSLALILQPFGIGWILVGGLMIVRGAPTLPPPRSADMEVAA